MKPSSAAMTTPAGARPHALMQAQLRWLQAVLPDPERPHQAPAPLLPAARTLALQVQAAQLGAAPAARLVQAAMALPALAARAGDPQLLHESQAFAGAVLQQGLVLQAQWWQGCMELAQTMGGLPQAGTVTRFVDQEMNLMEQGLALLRNQTTATARVAENIQVSLGWWISQQAQPD